MTETLSMVGIREQGEKETQHDRQAQWPRFRRRIDHPPQPRSGRQSQPPSLHWRAYKQRILIETDAAKTTGTLGSLLRRERLYSSLLVTWRRERDAGILKGLTPAKRGPKSKQNPLDGEVEKLRRQNALLTEDLRKPGIIIDVQNKLAMLLETLASQEEVSTPTLYRWIPASAPA